MRIGLILPQGFFNEFEDWPADKAWQRILAIAQLAEKLGFDSLWTGEHVLARWGGSSPAFDCWTLGAALANTDETLYEFLDDCRATGVTLSKESWNAAQTVQ